MIAESPVLSAIARWTVAGRFLPTPTSVVRTWNGANPGLELRHSAAVRALAFRQDGKQLATDHVTENSHVVLIRDVK